MQPKGSAQTGSSEVVAWILVSILTVLFTGLLTVNIIVLWVYKKRQARDNVTLYDMEDNLSYQAMATEVEQTAKLKHTTEAETYVYEQVGVGRIK